MKKNNIFQKTKNLIQIQRIDDYVKEAIEKKLNAGKVEEVLSIKTEKYWTCPPNMPSSYLSVVSKQNIKQNIEVRTTTGLSLRITQLYGGLNFEAACDNFEFSIYDENNKLLYFSNRAKRDAKRLAEEEAREIERRKNSLGKKKSVLQKFINFIQIQRIDDYVKEAIEKKLNAGKVEEVFSIETEKYWTCPPNMPSEYCSKQNIKQNIEIRTTTGLFLRVTQLYAGLNFEAACDNFEFSIYDENNNLLYFSDNAKRKEEEKERQRK